MSRIGERLKAHWFAQDLQPPTGVLEVYLQQFETHFGVTLPDDMRDYFLCINGMGGVLTDDNRLNWDVDLFRFWPLQEVLPVNDNTDYEGLNIADPAQFFIFADYSVLLRAYAIRLDPAKTVDHTVIAFSSDGDGARDPTVVALSFSEFAERYLKDDHSRIDLSDGTPGVT